MKAIQVEKEKMERIYQSDEWVKAQINSEEQTKVRSIEQNQNELLYTALYSRQGESLESYEAKRSVISNSDMAYEWYKSLVGFEIVENDKYLGLWLIKDI